jgi:hypothetical protein
MFPIKFVQGSFIWNMRTLGQTWPFLYSFPFCTLCKECTVAKRHTIAESALTNVYQTTHSFIFHCYPDHCLSLDCLYTSVLSQHQFFTSTEDVWSRNQGTCKLGPLLLARNMMQALLRCHYLCFTILLSWDRHGQGQLTLLTGNGQRELSVNRKSKST